MDQKVFVLTGDNSQLLDPAVQMSVLAKYSRSPDSALDILRRTTPEEAASFYQKYAVNYGHSSVAELAHLPFCFEGVSIVASKVLERAQRGTYSEKSTRYQEFSGASFVRPDGFPLALDPLVEELYRSYQAWKPQMEAYVTRVAPELPSSVAKARAFDALRYLLPAGTGTNLAGVFNTRDARYMMNDLLGHPLAEMRGLGEKMLGAARGVAPVFAAGVKPNTFTPQEMTTPPSKHFAAAERNEPEGPGTHLVHYDRDIERIFWEQANRYGLGNHELLGAHMEKRVSQAVPLFFRIPRMAFEVRVDYGAFRDLQRHRRCEQFVEPLTVDYGFVTPDDFIGAGLDAEYRALMESVRLYIDSAIGAGCDPLVAQYAIPLGYIHRSLFVMDLAEVYYVTELRTQPQGHISYRRAAWEMARAAKKRTELMQWCRAIEPKEIGAHA